MDSEGSVFRHILDAATVGANMAPEAGHEYIIGVDWGRTNDYTVFVVVDATIRAVVAMDRSNQVDYSLRCQRLRALAERFRPKQIIAEQNSIGQPVIEQLSWDGLRIEPVTTTNASKAAAIEALALPFERADIRILNNPVLINELIAYQAERLPSGLTRYTAPPGQHDDCVMALAIAWSAVTTENSPVYERELLAEPFDILESWLRVYALDLTPHRMAVIWGAMDPETKVVYLYDEYKSGDCDPQSRAREILQRGDWIPGVMDCVAMGALTRMDIGCLRSAAINWD